MNNKSKAIWEKYIFSVFDKYGLEKDIDIEDIEFDKSTNLKEYITTLHKLFKDSTDEKMVKVLNELDNYFECSDFEVVLGPNSKQWWVYSNRFDVWIDPPKEVLSKLSKDQDEAEKELYALVKTLPNWLFDIYYWYDAEMYDI